MAPTFFETTRPADDDLCIQVMTDDEPGACLSWQYNFPREWRQGIVGYD